MSNPPLISPVFQIDGNVLQYKPHVDYPDWIPVWDLSGFIPSLAYPDSALLLPDMADGISGGFQQPTIQAGQHLGQYNAMQGLNSEVEFKVVLSGGDYAARLTYIKLSSGGIVTLKCDGTTFTTIDTYNSTTQLARDSVVILPTGLSAGLHTINMKITSKNASSSAHDFLMSYLAIRRT